MTDTDNGTLGPLAGVRVLDLTVALAGPYCTLLLAGLGAEVIKIEAPTGGDIARFNPPFCGPRGMHMGSMEEGDVSLSLLTRARGKKSVSLDLKSEAGKTLFMRLAETADVVVDNLSDGTVERLGVDYESVRAVNPRLIYASISGQGRPSPDPNLKSMDIIIQALSGVMDVTGFPDGPPTRVGMTAGDLVSPLFTVIAILSALRERERTGEGQQVVTSMVGSLVSLLAFEHFDVFHRYGFPNRTGNYQNRLAPFGIYETRDGYVAIAAANDAWSYAIFEAIGTPELANDPRFVSRGPRSVNAGELNRMIEEWTSALQSAEVVDALNTQRGVPCVPVRSVQDALSDPYLFETGVLRKLKHPRLGEIDAVAPGLPVQFSASHVDFDRPAPDLGADTQEYLGRVLGLSDEELERLKDDGVI